MTGTNQPTNSIMFWCQNDYIDSVNHFPWNSSNLDLTNMVNHMTFEENPPLFFNALPGCVSLLNSLGLIMFYIDY